MGTAVPKADDWETLKLEELSLTDPKARLLPPHECVLDCDSTTHAYKPDALLCV